MHTKTLKTRVFHRSSAGFAEMLHVQGVFCTAQSTQTRTVGFAARRRCSVAQLQKTEPRSGATTPGTAIPTLTAGGVFRMEGQIPTSTSHSNPTRASKDRIYLQTLATRTTPRMFSFLEQK